MKSLIIGIAISTFAINAHACEEMKAAQAQAIVDYVCNYSLVSNTQCRVWKEDMRQMNYNNQIIVDSFISWDSSLEESQKIIAENVSEH